ncbi:hypothetical protein [Metabacillus sp. 84]|uniref:hypothetical protein n=1 Tax=Metabacillus sp. 84 TaxID=3404705 RepID=UPI003CF7729D
MGVWIVSLVAGLFILRLLIHVAWTKTIAFHVSRIKDHPNELQAAIFLKAMKKVLKIPNKPELWLDLKEAYFVILNSRHIEFETKLQIHSLLTKRRVYGLRKPYKRLHSTAVTEPSA